MADRMVSLKSMVDGTVTVKKPEFGVNRKWIRREQTMALPFSIVEQLLWDTGFKNMIDSGILYIESMTDKIDLGLEPEDATEPTNIIALSIKDMEKLWNEDNIEVFKKTVVNLPRVQVDNLISYAVEKEIADSEKCRFIKKLTGGKDILLSISRKQEEREYDEKMKNANIR